MAIYVVPAMRYTLMVVLSGSTKETFLEFVRGRFATKDEKIIEAIEKSLPFQQGYIVKISEEEAESMNSSVIRGTITKETLDNEMGIVEKPFKCKICGKDFLAANHLNLHMIRAHNVK